MMTPGLSASLTLMGSALCTELLASVVDVAPALNSAYALKDLTVSGLLLVGVVVLYRELARERKQNEENRANERRHADEAKTTLRDFIKDQNDFMLASTTKQVAALEEVVQTLGKLQDVSARQIATYDKHIEVIVKAATQKKD